MAQPIETRGSMRILGIDPGTAKTGLAVVEVGTDGNGVWIESTTVAPNELNPSLFTDYKVNKDISVVAIESPEGHNGPAIKYLAPTAQLAGECGGMCRVLGMHILYVKPREWRKVLCGRGNPTDASIAEALGVAMDLPKRSNEHTRDAAGLALVVGWSYVGGRGLAI